MPVVASVMADRRLTDTGHRVLCPAASVSDDRTDLDADAAFVPSPSLSNSMDMELWQSGFQLGHLRGVQPDKTTPVAGRFSKGTTRRWVDLDEA